jgi:DNA-binding NtrC family response regulator/tetratricopeptide (TPR) repeat protein
LPGAPIKGKIFLPVKFLYSKDFDWRDGSSVVATKPSRTYPRNLQELGHEIQAGSWRISAFVDPVSEKRFLLFSLKSKSISEFLPGIFSLRGAAGHPIVPSGCPEIVQLTTEGDRVDILTPYYELVDMNGLTVKDLKLLFETLLRTLLTFEKNGFYAGDLSPGVFGRDDAGEFYLFPNAYVLPLSLGESGPNARPGGRMNSRTDIRREIDNLHDGASSRIRHATLLGNLIDRLDLSPHQGRGSKKRENSPFVSRLLQTATRISNGQISTLPEAHRELFGKPPPKIYTPFDAGIGGSEQARLIDGCVDQIVDRVVSGGGIIVLTGEPFGGKSTVLGRAAERLNNMDSYEAISLDEWSFYSKSRRKFSPKGKPATPRIWLIDDIDDRRLVGSELSRLLMETDHFASDSIILSLDTACASGEVKDLLGQLQATGMAYHEIALGVLKAGAGSRLLAEYVRAMLEYVDPAGKVGGSEQPAQRMRTFLGGLANEERQLLEFVAVAHFAVPLELVLAVFPDAHPDLGRRIHALSALGILDLRYRNLPARNAVTLFLSMRSRSIRRLIYKSIPKARRKSLHHTIAVLAERYGGFPTFFLLSHSLRAEEEALAARYFVAYLKEHKGEKRHAFLASMWGDLRGNRLIERLSFSDKILTLHELGVDFIRHGQHQDAERLLMEAKSFIDTAGMDQKLKNAALLSSTYRLIADRWEARGEFKRALDLLTDVKEDLQSALSIPDQAQLLNDIGWLQYRLGDYDSSMGSCRLSMNTLNANQYPLIVAQALNLMGVVHYHTSRYDEAISYYEQSAHLRNRSADENALAASYNNMALAYQSKGEYQKALDCHNKSLEIKKRQNNRAGIAAGYLNLALLHLNAENLEEAEAKCRESLAISEELGHPQLTADNYSMLGDIALKEGDFKSAEQQYKKSLRIAHKMETINEEMGALRQLASLYLKQGKPERSREFASKALDLANRIGSKYETAQIETILGDLELEQNRKMEALKQYENAANHFTALSKYNLAGKVLAKIGLIHVEMGNPLEAQQFHDRSQVLVRSEIGYEIPAEFAELQRSLKSSTSKTRTVGDESQKLLMAYSDLSTLSDYAFDRSEFFKKVAEIIRQTIDPDEYWIALKTSGDRFLLLDQMGEQIPTPYEGMDALFRRTLLLGGILTNQSPDVADILSDISFSHGRALICTPLKALNDELGCSLFLLANDRIPLPTEIANFLTSLSRQIASNLKMMLLLNEEFSKEKIVHEQQEAAAEKPPHETRFEEFIAKSEPSKRILRTLEKVKDMDSGILILGESGTGKSVLARAIHYNSPRQNKTFQEIHCAQIPYSLLESELFGHERGSFTGAVQRKPGLCEVANGGTIFLDDINVIPVETQTKLLHFLESKSFFRLGGTKKLTSDVRIIAASNEDLQQLCKEGRFREDLYYRLKVIEVLLPPLRERKEDMLAIALDYLKRSCAKMGIPLKTLSPETIQLFQKAPWRGNVRELQNVLERIVILSDENIITPNSLPEDFLREVSGTISHASRRLEALVDEMIEQGGYSEENPLMSQIEALLAKRMVDHVKGKSRAAGLLGITKPTLYTRLKDYENMQ